MYENIFISFIEKKSIEIDTQKFYHFEHAYASKKHKLIKIILSEVDSIIYRDRKM